MAKFLTFEMALKTWPRIAPFVKVEHGIAICKMEDCGFEVRNVQEIKGKMAAHFQSKHQDAITFGALADM